MAIQTDQLQFFTGPRYETDPEYYSSSQIYVKFHSVDKTPVPFVGTFLPI